MSCSITLRSLEIFSSSGNAKCWLHHLIVYNELHSFTNVLQGPRISVLRCFLHSFRAILCFCERRVLLATPVNGTGITISTHSLSNLMLCLGPRCLRWLVDMAVFCDADYMGVILCAQFGPRCTQWVSD